MAAHAEARARAESGDLTSARSLLEDALAVGELRLGHSHPRLAPLMVDLATIARNLGNLTEARTQLRRAYAIIVAASGPEHATALSIEGRLAAVTYRLGEPTEAYDWHLADVGARVLGAEHPAVRGARDRLSRAQENADRAAYESAARAAFETGERARYDTGESPAYEGGSPPFEGGGPAYETGESPGRETSARAAFAMGPVRGPDEPGYAPTYAPSPYAAGVYDRVPREQGIYREQDIYVVEASPREYQDLEVWREPPLEARRRRGHGGGVAVVASLGAAILIGAVVVAVQVFVPRGSPTPGAAPTQAAEAAPTTAAPTNPAPAVSPSPTNVTIKDNGGSVTLTWVDPSGGKVPFIVAGGRDGTPSGPVASVPAGRTTSTIYGLNVRYNYCYTVTAVWSSSMIAPSIRTCTRRSSTPTAPAVSLGELTA